MSVVLLNGVQKIKYSLFETVYFRASLIVRLGLLLMEKSSAERSFGSATLDSRKESLVDFRECEWRRGSS